MQCVFTSECAMCSLVKMQSVLASESAMCSLVKMQNVLSSENAMCSLMKMQSVLIFTLMHLLKPYTDHFLNITFTLVFTPRAYLLGLLAMIKCSICSYQCDNWYNPNWGFSSHFNFSMGGGMFAFMWRLSIRCLLFAQTSRTTGPSGQHLKSPLQSSQMTEILKFITR